MNSLIRVPEVRLIDAEGAQVGLVSTHKAIEMAQNAGLDLVEVSPGAKPPVCKIMDFGKYKFQQSKKSALAKKKQKQVHLKEIKFRPVTEEADYQVKLKKIIEFLEEGDKVKVTMRFRGREIAHQELGEAFMARLQQDVLEVAAIEQAPRFEGKQIVMMLGPKK